MRQWPRLCVVGARPNYMKMAPLLRAIKSRGNLPSAVLVHTGQHYDFDLNGRLFVDVALPAPDVNLEVGSGSHAIQTAEVMKRFEPVIDQHRPSCVVVVGDVNSTLACALVAAKKHVPVAHVEAGLRSFDRSMPEEITTHRLSVTAGVSRNGGSNARRSARTDRLGRGAGRTTALGVPCLAMRPNTERPITVDERTDTLVGVYCDRILGVVDKVIHTGGTRGRMPEYWDGKAAPRVAAHMAQWLACLDGVSATE